VVTRVERVSRGFHRVSKRVQLGGGVSPAKKCRRFSRHFETRQGGCQAARERRGEAPRNSSALREKAFRSSKRRFGAAKTGFGARGCVGVCTAPNPARFSRRFETRSDGGGALVWCKTGARHATHSPRAFGVSRGKGGTAASCDLEDTRLPGRHVQVQSATLQVVAVPYVGCRR